MSSEVAEKSNDKVNDETPKKKGKYRKDKRMLIFSWYFKI